MPFIPLTPKDRQEMLHALGVERFEDLLQAIPRHLLFKGDLRLPSPLSEMEVMTLLRRLSQQNDNCEDNICFLGGGAYDHYVPAPVKHILSRSEFYTAYTPYQPEVSQGTLQAIYEYQTMICELTGMDVANASMYDGGTSLAEAVLLASGHTRRNKVLISSTVNPRYVDIIRTYTQGQDIELVLIAQKEGVTDVDALKAAADENLAAVVIQHPNFFGNLEDMAPISQITHDNGALFITSNDPISLALLEPPGSYGTDIATGEGQSLGNPLNFGGPYLGIFTSTKALVRKIPGRLVGETTDQKGRRGFVLTLQTREQHIRREKATSNICTNNGLNALAATVYMALMGKNGLKKVAELSLQKSHYLASKINELNGFKLKFDQPFFKEFVVETTFPVDKVLQKLLEAGIFAGIPLANYFPEMENCFLCAVTEKRTKDEIDYFVTKLREQFN